MHFRRVLIEDFRGFSQNSCFSTVTSVFVHAFERFQVVNGFQMRSFCDSLHGSDKFSNKNHRNFDALHGSEQFLDKNLRNFCTPKKKCTKSAQNLHKNCTLTGVNAGFGRFSGIWTARFYRYFPLPHLAIHRSVFFGDKCMNFHQKFIFARNLRKRKRSIKSSCPNT